MDRLEILHLSNVIGDKKGGGIHEVVSNFYKYQKTVRTTSQVFGIQAMRLTQTQFAWIVI